MAAKRIAVFLCLLLVSAVGWAQSKISLWSEFVPYATLREALAPLAQLNLGLIVAVREDKLAEPEFSLSALCGVFREAATLGVPVSPWLLLSEKNEYWFNKSNHRQARDFALSFVGEFQRSCGEKIDWLTFDMESPKRLSLDLLAIDASGDQLEEALRAYRSLLNELHAKGIRVHGVTSHFVLNEPKEDPWRIQQAKSIPFRGLPWDKVSFMLYKAEFEDKARRYAGIPLDYSSGLIYEYAKRAVAQYGDYPLAIDLGEIGTVLYPELFQGLQHAWELYFDMLAVEAAGIHEVHIYSLDGLLAQAGGKPWAQRLSDFTRPRAAQISRWRREHVRESHEAVNIPAWGTMRALDLLFATFPESGMDLGQGVDGAARPARAGIGD